MTGSPSDSYGRGLFRTASAGNLGRSYAAKRRKERRASASKPKPRANKAPAKPKEKRVTKRDQVAALLACGLDFGAIAERMGVTLKAVHRHFEDIRRDLGWQAR